MDNDERKDGRTTPADSLAQERKRYTDRVFLTTPWPALNTVLSMEVGHKRFVTLALPWEPGGETPFHIAQAAAKQGLNPLCLFPSWSPYWDGTLNVHRRDDLPASVNYRDMVQPRDGTGMVIIDQFSRLHWGDPAGHKSREEVVDEVGKELLALSLKASIPVLVLLRRKKGSAMSVQDLRSDGALEYTTDVLAMVDPSFPTETATLNVVKDRMGPTGVTSVSWPVLPRTMYRRADTA